MTTLTQNIPQSLCKCGCAKPTRISKITVTYKTRRGLIQRVKGQPEDYLVGHSNRIIPTIEDALPFKIEGVYCRLIPLTRECWAIVWESDYVWLMQWKWWAWKTKKSKNFYAIREEGRKHIFMHELLGGNEHKNRNSLDNRRCNLRPATKKQNNCNKGLSSRNKSGYKGVSRARNKWVVYIEDSWVGGFDIITDAARAYDREAVKRFGEFAWLNFPEERNIHERAWLESR